jgi:hypothetical protein
LSAGKISSPSSEVVGDGTLDFSAFLPESLSPELPARGADRLHPPGRRRAASIRLRSINEQPRMDVPFDKYPEITRETFRIF